MVLPDAGFTCSERWDSVLHPLDRFADEPNEEDSSPSFCYLTLPGTGQATSRDQKVYLGALSISAPKRNANKHLSKVKIGKKNKEKPVGNGERK